MRFELVALLESVLGDSSPRKQDAENDNIAFHCPNSKCGSYHTDKKKLEVNLMYRHWHCWVCHAAGRQLKQLLRFSGKATKSDFKELRSVADYVNIGQEIDIHETAVVDGVMVLPEGSVRISSLEPKQAERYLDYLFARGLRRVDIVRYDLHCTDIGDHRNRIIIPTYDANGKLVDYSSRAISDKEFFKYLEPIFDKRSVIGFESTINWNLPIVLVEGKLDAIAVRHNAIPLSGTKLFPALKVALMSAKQDVFVCLDSGATNNAIKICRELIAVGLNVKYVNLPMGQDPSSLGYREVWKYINQARPAGFELFMNYELYDAIC